MSLGLKIHYQHDTAPSPSTLLSDTARHTYICKLIEGANIYALAKNCGTSVEMNPEILRRAHQGPARRIRNQQQAAAGAQGELEGAAPELHAFPDT